MYTYVCIYIYICIHTHVGVHDLLRRGAIRPIAVLRFRTSEGSTQSEFECLRGGIIMSIGNFSYP